MTRNDARLCALWGLPVTAQISGEPEEFGRIAEICENYAAPSRLDAAKRHPVEWYAILEDRSAREYSVTKVKLEDVEPKDAEQFSRMKENYERFKAR